MSRSLRLTQLRFATVAELFHYKRLGFELPPFPGYTTDQWGIKAHNRPWVALNGRFAPGQKVVEVGGAYSSLPAYLADQHGVEAWVGDDFGASEPTEEAVWSRWGDPRELPRVRPQVKYVFQNFGEFSPEFPDRYFDRVFSVSTLEHVPAPQMDAMWKDMHRVLAPGGVELHTIDVPVVPAGAAMVQSVLEAISLRVGRPVAFRRWGSQTYWWLRSIAAAGVDVSEIGCARFPYSYRLLSRQALVESVDVVYRFYPPNGAPKPYAPSASLLAVIQDG
jgi:SAM-dependent methyltransferase